MAKIIAKFNKIALSIASALFILFPLIGVSGGMNAAAETEGTDSVIMRELGGLTIGGEKFDAANYPADKEGTPALINLNEMGYGYTVDKQVAFGLTLYIYNPAQLDIKEDLRNTVQMRIGNADRYRKYGLNVIESSSDKLFFKLGVSFTDTEKSAALAALSDDSRVYEVSSVEFYLEGFNATSFDISPTRVFTYTGYAAGLGESGESTLAHTLSYTVTGGTETIPLKVEHTSWRPEGTNGNSKYTQDTIHSVYFAVPKELDEKYDYLKSVQAQWLEARLAPVYVSGNKTIYDALQNVIDSNATTLSDDDNNLWTGADPGKKAAPEQFDLSKFDYFFGAGDYTGMTSITYEMLFCNDWWYQKETSGTGISVKKRLKTLFLTVFTNGIDASEYVVSSDELTDLVRKEAINGRFENDKKVAGKYPSYLFESYDEGVTTKIIKVGEASEAEKENETIITDDKLNLHSERVNESWWQTIFGKHSIENQQDYKNIKAIQSITDSDVSGKTPKELCNSLYISERDATDFVAYYSENKNDSNIYLMRFSISEYWSAFIETIGRKGSTLQPNLTGVVDRNAYFAQETCFLDFDIIDFEYVKDDETFVIPVSMSPIDIFPELTPPPTYEDFWPYGLAIMGGLIAFYVVYRISRKVVRG